MRQVAPAARLAAAAAGNPSVCKRAACIQSQSPLASQLRHRLQAGKGKAREFPAEAAHPLHAASACAHANAPAPDPRRAGQRHAASAGPAPQLPPTPAAGAATSRPLARAPPAMIASIKKTTFHRDVYEPAEVCGEVVRRAPCTVSLQSRRRPSPPLPSGPATHRRLPTHPPTHLTLLPWPVCFQAGQLRLGRCAGSPPRRLAPLPAPPVS